MKKLLSGVAVATLLMTNVMAGPGTLTVNGSVSPFATVAFGGSVLTTAALNGENTFINSNIQLGTHTPSNFTPVLADVYSISNKSTALVSMAFSGTSALSDGNGHTIPMLYQYQQLNGNVVNVPIDGSLIAVGGNNDGSKAGEFRAFAQPNPIQAAGNYATSLTVTISAV